MYHALLLLFAVIATAPSSGIAGNSWNTLNAQLQSEGINPAQVNWTEVNRLCAGFRGNVQAYQDCRHDKARDERRYWSDRQRCERDANSNRYGNDRYSPVHIRTYYNHIDPKTQKHLLNHYRAIAQQRQRREQRLYGMEDCMQEKRWVDPDNWRMGRDR